MKTTTRHFNLICLFALFIPATAISRIGNDINLAAKRTFNSSVTERVFNEEIFKKHISQSPQGFTENKGQVIGYDGLPHDEVKFVLQEGNTQIFILEKGIAYQFTKVNCPNGYEALMQMKPEPKDLEKIIELQKQIGIETYRMDMSLKYANPHAIITAEGKSEDHVNFYNHNVLDVHHYSKVTFHDIYPGIDWVLHIQNGKVKYDFVVKPGVDPSMIKMEFKYHNDLEINGDGGFTLRNRMGSISEKKPISYQAGKKINTRFVQENNSTITFNISAYDRSQLLVIDPTLMWATYYGGSSSDYGYSCSADASGNVYLAGTTLSSSNIAAGGYQNTLGGGSNIYDAFLVKFDGAGTRLWATYYGDVANDYGYACAADGSGNVYLAGTTNGGTSISSGGQQNTFGGFVDAFLVKFNSSGVRQWATYYGGNNSESGASCSTDALGNVYMAGSTASSSGIASGGFQNTTNFNGDAYLVKFNSSGTRLWATYYGGGGVDAGNSCATDASGNVYLAGDINSGGFGYMGYQNTYGGGQKDAFLVKFNSTGVRQWSTYYGDTGDDTGTYCSTDTPGNVYLTGTTPSIANIASGGYLNTFGGGPGDAFLVKFNSSGARQWATYYGDTGNDSGTACSVDGSGNIYFAGTTSSTINIASGGYQNTYGGAGFDAFLVMFNASGVRQWGSYYGGSGADYGYTCLYTSGNVYLAGASNSGANIASGGHQNTNGGGLDAFIVKFCEYAPMSSSAINGNTVVCIGNTETYSITNPSAGTFAWSLPPGWTGISTTNTISVTTGLSGIFTVQATNACGAAPLQTLSITSNANPSITVNSGSICMGQSFSISAAGAQTYTYQGGSPIVTPIVNTSYSVTGASSAGCISQIAISNVTINPIPLITVNSGSICSGQNFTIIATGAQIYTYSGGSAVVSPTVNSSYSITGTSSAGCTSTMVAISQVTVQATPVLTVSSGAICLGKSFTITAGGATTYTFQSGSSVVSPTTSTNYSVTGANATGCQYTSISSITVLALPVLVLSAGNNTICKGENITYTVSGAGSYIWSNGVNNNIVNLAPNINTSYSVTGTDINGCKNTLEFILEVDECTGLQKSTKNNISITIYPNPSKGLFTIQSANIEHAEIIIYNLLGEKILVVPIMQSSEQIDLGTFANGIYTLVILVQNEIVKGIKLLKE